jgi:hypothetical protein
MYINILFKYYPNATKFCVKPWNNTQGPLTNFGDFWTYLKIIKIHGSFIY